MSNPIVPPFNYELIGILTEQFAMFEPRGNSLEGVRFWTQVSFAATAVNSVIAKAFVQFEQDDHPVLVCESACTFEVQGLTSNALGLVLPVEFARLLASVAFGITRGILHSRTQGTPLAALTLPLIDIASFIDAEVMLKLPDEDSVTT